jgi:hypothetical protein
MDRPLSSAALWVPLPSNGMVAYLSVALITYEVRHRVTRGPNGELTEHLCDCCVQRVIQALWSALPEGHA